MDFVAAKAILDKFANTYRAAEFMAEALETAASLERRGMELQANVEHLQKEEAAQQQALTDMQAAFAETQHRLTQEQGVRVAGFREDAGRVEAEIATRRTQAQANLDEAKTALTDYVSRSHAIIADLDERIKAKQEEVTRLDAQIEALKAQARQVLT